jgi:hypothetical protein
VLVRNAAERERVEDILEQFNPIQIDEGSMVGAAGATLGTPHEIAQST